MGSDCFEVNPLIKKEADKIRFWGNVKETMEYML